MSYEEGRKTDGLVSALRGYQQADEDGVMCIVSRQAVEEAADEIEYVRQSVIAFAGPWAAQWARDHGLPDRHLHPRHFDLLARCGARMDEFTRALAAVMEGK